MNWKPIKIKPIKMGKVPVDGYKDLIIFGKPIERITEEKDKIPFSHCLEKNNQ
jgi:hypothetical protein